MEEAETELPKRMDEYVAPSVAPGEVSDELRPRIDELGLWDAVRHMRDHGYAVIREAAPPELMDDLRDAIHALATKSADATGIASAPMLLGRHPAVDRVATLPKIMAFAEFSVGKAMRAGRFVGSIKPEGGAGLALHADQNWIPTPFPDHNLLVTFCFACEGMTKAGGATRVAPDSHRHRRPPQSAEAETVETVSIDTEKGDVAVWDGAVWHGGYPRTIAGTRTVLHATYQRLYTQPIDDFTYLLKDADYMANAPAGMRQLLGADLFFHTATPEHDLDMKKFMYAVAASKL